MIKSKDFLFEIGCEELPPKTLKSLVEELTQLILQGLQKAELSVGEARYFATPRRLAVVIKEVVAEQESHSVERKGPATKAAFTTDGKPTPALEGFMRSCQCSVDELQTLTTEQGSWVTFRQQVEGKSTKELLPQIITQAISRLSLPKSMRWDNGGDIEFVRPVHWATMLYGDEVIEANILGQKTGKNTYGHRFHHPEAISISDASTYEQSLLETGKVVADFGKRQQMIREQVIAAAKKISATAIIDEDLLLEVTGLVEWPVAVTASFNAKFLEVPPEALISVMKTHQKCFPVADVAGKLQSYFITISNIESKDPQQVVIGNERVMAARLADAAFFYHSDCRQSLESRVEDLKNVVFQVELGSLHDKAHRIARLAAIIAPQILADVKSTEKAGLLAKADLMSQMVGEFPELQGVMGYYYARKEGSAENIALAIREHYLPRFSGDELPHSLEGCAVALADRLDKLVGIFGINQLPSGDKDPFALRRAALGVLRIIIEKQFSLDVDELLKQAHAGYQIQLKNRDVLSQLQEFLYERLRAWYQEQGIAADIFAAVLARKPTQPFDFHRRIHAVIEFIKLPQAKSLALANKRVSNILAKENVKSHLTVDQNLFEHDAERELAKAIAEKSEKIAPFYASADYTRVLTELAQLQIPIDNFFDHVMVMVEDENLRNNRLALLNALRNEFLLVADISLLQT